MSECVLLLKRMIELTLKDVYENLNEGMLMMMKILTWFSSVVQTRKDLEIPGVIIANDKGNHALIICEEEQRNELVKILMQPPGEFKEKYIASVANEAAEESGEMKIEVDEGEEDSVG